MQPGMRTCCGIGIVVCLGLIAPATAMRAAEFKDAVKALQEKNYPRIVEILDPYLAEHPRDARALALRGRAYVELFAADKALADLNRAIEIQPLKTGGDFLSRGRAHLLLHHYDEALADLNVAVEHNPNDAERYYFRGQAYSQQEKHEAAFPEFHKAIELDPQHFRAYAARGFTQWRKGTKYQATSYQQGAHTYVLMRFESVVDRDLVDQGLADFARAIELAPDDPRAYQQRSQCNYELKDWPKYAADRNQLVRLLPNDARLLNETAWFLATIDYDAVRDGKRALELAEKACELTKHEDFASLDTMAAALAETRKFKRAAEVQDQAIARAKDLPEQVMKMLRERREQYRRKQPLRLTDPRSI